MSLEGIYRMDEGHRRIKKAEELVHPVTEEEIELGDHDRTLAQIMQDKAEQDRFLGSFCYQKDQDATQEIVDSLATNTLLTPEQNKFLENMRGAYNLRRAEAERVREMLPENIQHIANVDPRIQQIVGMIGPEKTAELLGKEFEEMAFRDDSVFKKSIKQMRLLRDVETNELTGALDQHVRATLSKYGISEEKYWEATMPGEDPKTQENLGKLASEQYGWFKTAVDFASDGKLSRYEGGKLYRNFEEQNAVLETCNKHLKALGKILQGTLNADVNVAIQKAMLEGGDVKEKTVGNNVRTIDEYNAAKNDLQSRQSRWEQFKESEVKRMNISDMGKQPDAVEHIKDRFVEQEYQKQKQYRARGVFAALLALLFGTGTKDDIRTALK